MQKWQREARSRAVRMIANCGGYSGLGEPIRGYSDFGAERSVALLIGRRAGLDFGRWREGQQIAERDVLHVVRGLRAQQVGARNAGDTVTATKGRYKGKPERGVRVEILHDEFAVDPKTGRSVEPTARVFRRNIKRLAERAAGALAQREIILLWSLPKDRHRAGSATPPGAPGPLAKKFCDWVRARSRNARTDPSDPCYRAPTPGAPGKRA